MKRTIQALSDEIRRGRVSPIKLTEQVLQRVERLNPTINSYITILKERALQEAGAAEAAIKEGKYLGPLQGIPVAIKDIIYIKGVRCTAGSKILESNVATEDSTVVKRLTEAGAVIVGTTNLHEFASGVTSVNPFYGPVRNPWDTERISGGSSGGSAAAVAAEMAVAAVGTDTSGSVRIPAALCGVVGLKPTYGRISRVGVIPLANSFDTVGVLTSCVWDAAAMLKVLAGHEEGDETTEDVRVPNYLSELKPPAKELRLGIPRQLLEAIDPKVGEQFSKFIERVARGGGGGVVSIGDVSLGEMEGVREAWGAIRRSEAVAFHEQWLSTVPEKYGEDVRRLLEKGREVTAVQYMNAQNSRPRFRKAFLEVMSKVDFLVLPTTPVVAPKIGQDRVELGGKAVDLYAALSSLTLPFNVVGFPVISIPIGYVDGLPVGAQIVGRPFDEASLLTVASLCEKLLALSQVPRVTRLEGAGRIPIAAPRLSEPPLVGVKVLELGTAVAGPLCSSLLGDMGAEVIKVEAPEKGDDSRGWGAAVKGESPYFVQYNRNKRSLALDVRTEDGRAILLKLVKSTDVLIENFRPGTMERLGLSYETLTELNRRLIVCSISGFGQTGPYSELGGYDAIIQALSGLMSVTGQEGGPPTRVGVPITDILAALYAAFSVTLALLARRRTGRGQMIDVSLFESGVSAVAQWMTISKLTGSAIIRFGNKYPLLAPYELFQAKDRPFVVAVGNEEQWARLCKALERENLINDPRFKTNAERIRPDNREALTRVLQGIFFGRPAEAWVGLLSGSGIPVGVIASIEDLLRDPQLRARGTFAEVEHGSLGKVEIVDALPKFSETPGRVSLPSPRLGEHTEEILNEVGIPGEEILRLRKEGTIR